MDPPKARSDFKEQKKQKSPGILPGIVGKGTEIPATAFYFHDGGLQLPQTHREEEQIHRSQRGTRLVFLDAVGDAASEVGLELNNTNGLVEIDVYKLRDVANQNFMLLDYSTSNRMGYPLVI
jgi:hypothetical protein